MYLDRSGSTGPTSMSERLSWTQPSCDDCWYLRNPGRDPQRINEPYRALDVCCYCGNHTESGIYVRTDPSAVPFPTLLK